MNFSKNKGRNCTRNNASSQSAILADGLQSVDHGPCPYVMNLADATLENQTYRTALWTGNYLQLTLMSLPVGEEIGLEMHSYIDQFLRVEQGNGTVSMGRCKEHLDIKHNICDDYAIFVPAGTWHNIVNTGDIPLKLYSIYSPPKHPKGTVHQTKADAIFDELKH